MPTWQPVALCCPTVCRHWLTDRGSLTQRLRQHSHGDFQVRLLRQGWQLPRADEALQLHAPLRQLAFVREVILLGKGQEWVYARTVIPLAAAHGRMRALQQLGTRPLGEWLFNHPAVIRGPLRFARWPDALLPPELSSATTQPLWGRHSVFRLGPASLMVSEIFLPALLQS